MNQSKKRPVKSLTQLCILIPLYSDAIFIQFMFCTDASSCFASFSSASGLDERTCVYFGHYRSAGGRTAGGAQLAAHRMAVADLRICDLLAEDSFL